MQSHRKQIYTVYTFNPPINENLFHIIAQNKITRKRYSAILRKIKFANEYAGFFSHKNVSQRKQKFALPSQNICSKQTLGEKLRKITRFNTWNSRRKTKKNNKV